MGQNLMHTLDGQEDLLKIQIYILLVVIQKVIYHGIKRKKNGGWQCIMIQNLMQLAMKLMECTHLEFIIGIFSMIAALEPALVR